VLRLIAALVLMAAAWAVGLGVWVARDLSTPYFGAAAPAVFVDVPHGAGSARIVGLLQEAGVIRHTLPLRLHLARSGLNRRLQAGEYLFRGPATPVQIADRLARGDVFVLVVTIPEGLTADETVGRVVAAGLGSGPELRGALARTDAIRDLAPEAASLEGYLYPETYRFARRTPPAAVIGTMVARFRQVYARLADGQPPAEGWSVHRLVTLASMIEKETSRDAERGQVASVLVNRLRIGMPLACDPTLIYALKLARRYDGNIRKADLAIESPYNTYRLPGLPPGPIANPGEASLRAALRPERTDLLYFVSRNDGTHEFSHSYADHSRAVARFQLRGRAHR
jgi:UPF0755 protein